VDATKDNIKIMFWESPERRKGSQSIGNRKRKKTRGWIPDGFTLHKYQMTISDSETIPIPI
jgi:hypothetical protein